MYNTPRGCEQHRVEFGSKGALSSSPGIAASSCFSDCNKAKAKASEKAPRPNTVDLGFSCIGLYCGVVYQGFKGFDMGSLC